jgi:AcrR family transcriptional regulator
MTPNQRSAHRLEELVDAATTVFALKGYKRARIDEIARVAGISPGTVYNHVASKDALFRIVLERAIEGEQSGQRVTDTSPDATLKWVARRLDFVSDFPAMEAALACDKPADSAAEVGLVFAELFDVLLRTRHAAAILERSAAEMTEVREFFGGLRRELYARVSRYVGRREAAGVFIPLADPHATARLLVEATAWATHGRLAQRDGQPDISNDAARAALVEMATRTLVGATEAPDEEVRDEAKIPERS